MTLRFKLIVTFLFISLTTATTVGGIAWWMLMQDFRQSVQEQAFSNFQTDVTNYIAAYGSWEDAVLSEPFGAFVTRTRNKPHIGNRAERTPDHPIQRQGQARFHFLLLNPQGQVLMQVDGFPVGTQAPEDILRKARPIRIDDRLVVLASPLGDPVLTSQDQAYLTIMRQAFVNGISVAVVLSLLLGFLLGTRLSASLRELTLAIRSMRLDGSRQAQVPIRSNDEVGLLADAFNRMSSELSKTHNDLQQSSQLVQAQADELKELSIRDPLTHLYNRRHFDEQATTLYNQAVRHGRPFSVMLGDLDHFKSINDNFSHAIGDEVLRRVACLLLKNTRNSDIAARYGGEEFVVAFAESTAQQSFARCEELRQHIERYPWKEIHPDLKVTMSMGLSDTVAMGKVEKMLVEADSRLYKAKRGGRNRVIAD